MSGDFVDTRDGVPIGANMLLARAAAAETRARHRLRTTIGDLFVPDAFRLDERLRTEVRALLQAAVDATEAALLNHFRALLGADMPLGMLPAGAAWRRLRNADALRDPELIGELLARVRLDQLGGALPSLAPDDPERPSLIARFVGHLDPAVADAARGLLVAESRRRSPEMRQAELPASLQRQLVWLVAAALRDAIDGPGEHALDVVLCEAARRVLADPLADQGLETAAMQFAGIVDAQPPELPALLVEALRDRCIPLFTAMLAQAAGLAYATARALVIEPEGERLLLALHGLAVPRDALAQIGYALCEADPRRNLPALADTLDAVATMAPEQARAALAPLSLDPEYRAARLALADGEGAG